MKIKLLLLFIATGLLLFSSCKKNDAGNPIRIVGTYTSAESDGTLVGTFVMTGGLSASGATLMDITPVGTDSIYCINHHFAAKGEFIVEMKCSLLTNTGVWKVISGTKFYNHLHGGGTLVMTFPKDVLGVETMTGIVWRHP